MPAIFPRWTNKIPLAIAVLGPVFGVGVIFGIWYWWSPAYTDAGYRPEQPIHFSHKLHAGDMGLDCRYCHNTVERAAHAAIPPTATCMNCHSQVKKDSPKLKLLRDSWDSLTTPEIPEKSIPWIRVHQLPDYAFFDHRPHLAAGVGCSTCHGRIDQMVVVELNSPLSMGWCLDCHRDPEPNLRPLDRITDMGWFDRDEAKTYDYKQDPKRKRKAVEPPEHCSGCHR
ncbi:MAG: cytochrome c3 family protein [Myxococcales bacterium]|nr:cytochrome c3 family protein [Myxococcales bacterium]